MSETIRRLLATPQGALGVFIVGLILIVAAFGNTLAPLDPEALSPLNRYKPPGAEFLLGTDQYGRDILSRLLVGSRSTVFNALTATLLGTALGVMIGMVSAYLGGFADEAIMRTVDAVMSIPSLLFALLIVNLFGKSSLNAVLAIAIAFAPGMARVTRAVALSVRRQDFIGAAIARGEGSVYIITREMLPNVIAPILVEATIRVAFAVMLFATLSFLGLGAQPPAADWGLMVAEARRYMHLSAWIILGPSLAVALVAIGFNLLGDGLRDALNPRT